MKLKHLFLSGLLLLGAAACNDDNDAPVFPEDPVYDMSGFAKGADVSWLTQMEASGVRFYTADGRVKPDVVSMGSGCYVLEGDGSLRTANGTSFATPILAGLATCLWQALPHLDARAIRLLVCRYASQYRRPDAELGYGIPNIYQSYKKGSKYGK